VIVLVSLISTMPVGLAVRQPAMPHGRIDSTTKSVQQFSFCQTGRFSRHYRTVNG
jgi:hypothetical protein